MAESTLEGEVLPPAQPPARLPPSGQRICLRDVDAVRREMGRVYRDARRGQMESTEAAKLTYILAEIRRTFEVTVLERRLAALENNHGHA